MLGYTLEECLRLNILDTYPDDMRPVGIQRLADLQIGKALRFERPMKRHDGGIVLVEAHAWKDSDGNVQAIVRDDTDRKNMEDRLQRAEKMESLGLLAGGVAHDLNNALGILIGYSELLYDGFDEDDSRRRDVKNIMIGGEQAAAIVQDLLTLARRSVQTKTVINLNKTITEYFNSSEYMKLTSFHPNIHVKLELEDELLNINGSHVHLSKTLMNLVSNAAEAMTSGGNLIIRTENRYLDVPVSGYDKIGEGDYVALTVSDEGEGISDDDMKRIFEPFYTKKVMGRSGTGLGLSVVWGTMKDHDGYIDVQSRIGKGTTFTLYFPVTRNEMEKDVITTQDEYMGRGERILVVDDVESQRDLASRILTKLNYQVATIASGEEAVEYLKTKEADLIVLDMIMEPGIDGFETYRQISYVHPKQKAIIVSGYAETERVSMAQSLGAGAFVKKPYIRERIGLAVRRELDRK
jgi:two-component system, cell cycle sensor histidine kinase and response regulator CckA